MQTTGISQLCIPASYDIYGRCNDMQRKKIETTLAGLNMDSLMPGLQFMWSLKKEKGETGQFEHLLYAVKMPRERDPHLGIRHIATAVRSRDQNNGQLTVDISFTPEGSNVIAELTGNNIGRSLAMVVNNKVISAPNVINAVPGGNLQESGNFSLEEVTELSELINKRVLNGELREYHENGKLKAIRTFENGEQVGSWKTYDENGKLIKEHKAPLTAE